MGNGLRPQWAMPEAQWAMVCDHNGQ